MHKIASIRLSVAGILAVLLFGGMVPGYPAANSSQKKESLETRIQRLEDREEIGRLLKSYGQFLDKRDFAAFSQLFSEKDGAWIGGMGQAKGSPAIRKFMEDKIGTSIGKPGLPNCHLFTNEMIDVNGNQARATTKWIFVVQGDASRPQIVYIGHYADLLVRENGRWKFLRRTVYVDIPAE